MYNITLCHIKEENYTMAHKSILKVMEGIPSGEVKD